MLRISREVPRQPAVIELLELSDEFAASLYPADSCYLLDVSELEAPGVAVFVARTDAAAAASAEPGAAVGMAALVTRGDGSAELKRMFVAERARGLGVAGALLAAVQEQAAATSVSVIQLETGPKQPAAIALYEKHGYVHIPNFGQYVGDEFSVCMEKRL